MEKLRPLCPTCKVRRINRGARTYCSNACVPSAIRQTGGRKGGQSVGYRRRAARFKAILDRWASLEKLTREDLCAGLHEAWGMGRHSERQARYDLRHRKQNNVAA
jgi:hypothetical protein